MMPADNPRYAAARGRLNSGLALPGQPEEWRRDQNPR